MIATIDRYLTWPRVLCLGVIFGAVLTLSGCGAKANEPFKDTRVTGRVDNGAVIGSMPDGFNNWARTCDGTTAVYTPFHGDNPYGAVAVVANSPECGGR